MEAVTYKHFDNRGHTISATDKSDRFVYAS